jgi:hypothetical protein
MLYNLYFITLINNLGIHISPLNRNGDSSTSIKISANYKNTKEKDHKTIRMCKIRV